MFRTVNGEEKAQCQENPGMFSAMRRSQYEAWPEEALELYLQQLAGAETEGRNLVREKYIRMMRSTDPEEYALLSGGLPDVSPESRQLACEIWEILDRQTREMRAEFPDLAEFGRPMDEQTEEDWASVKTYQTAELLTYSEQVLEVLLSHIRSLEACGTSYARMVQENTLRSQGFASLEEADAFARRRFLRHKDGGVCSCDYGL